MTSLRFPLALGVALAFGAATAHAQSAPGQAPAASHSPQAKIMDIEVAQEGDRVSILVKLSAQPSAASATAANNQLKLAIDGVSLVGLSLSPPPGTLVGSVTASKGEIVLGGVALTAPDVVIYRHAVLVTARLAEPADIKGASLLAGAVALPAPPPPPVAVKPPAAKPAPAPFVAPAPVAPAVMPVAAAEADLAPQVAPAPQPAPQHPPEPSKPDDELQSSPAPAAIAAGRAATLAGIDAARCTAAASELAKDSWALGAMGDVALCLIDAGKPDEARARLDQLGAITPQDWRVSLGQALLASDAEDAASVNALFLAASLGAPNDDLRVAIAAHIKPEITGVVDPQPVSAPTPEPDLQIPLPK